MSVRSNSPGSVFSKLILFSIAVIILPIAAYYLSLEYFFQGYKTTYAAITAAVTANIVLFGYVAVAFLEDDTITQDKVTKKKQ